MLQMLSELTKSWFFLPMTEFSKFPMSEFSKFILNCKEVLEAIDADGCVEFGTVDGQQLLIYDLSADGRKHIRYSCTMTTFYDYIVLEDAYGQDGNKYTTYNWEKWYNLAGQKAAAEGKKEV